MALLLSKGLYLGHTTTSNHSLFINWLLGVTLIPGFNQAIMGFTRPSRVDHYTVDGCLEPNMRNC